MSEKVIEAEKEDQICQSAVLRAHEKMEFNAARRFAVDLDGVEH